MRIVFMGTPDFAVASLKKIINQGFNVVGVVTVPDKPAGRGLEMQQSPVKRCALEHNIPVLQPEKLKDPDFITQLKELHADVQVVVAFRMLPEIVWNMPLKGTFNLHGSLLPQYRGAAPINWAIINGEKETGVTTFFIKHEIDTGNIIYQEKIEIGENDTAEVIHDKLMFLGADLVCKTLHDIEKGSCPNIPQDKIQVDELKSAPKLFKESCKINWNQNALQIHNFIRGLSPHPGAWTELINDSGKKINFKIFETRVLSQETTMPSGTIATDGKKQLHVFSKEGCLNVLSLQQEGKKRLSAEEFLRGFQMISTFRVSS